MAFAYSVAQGTRSHSTLSRRQPWPRREQGAAVCLRSRSGPLRWLKGCRLQTGADPVVPILIEDQKRAPRRRRSAAHLGDNGIRVIVKVTDQELDRLVLQLLTTVAFFVQHVTQMAKLVLRSDRWMNIQCGRPGSECRRKAGICGPRLLVATVDLLRLEPPEFSIE